MTLGWDDDFYKKAIDIIYAFIIGQSFLQLDSLLIPVGDVATELVNISGLFLAYFIIVTGWIGYHRSVTNQPHRGIYGTFRFIIDLIIIFLVYYLLRLSNPFVNSLYAEIFIWLIPLIFFFYSVWDLIKLIEYKPSRTEFRDRAKRARITVLFMFIFLFLGGLYANMTEGLVIYTNNKTSLDIWFIVIYAVMILLYRSLKWNIAVMEPGQ